MTLRDAFRYLMLLGLLGVIVLTVTQQQWNAPASPSPTNNQQVSRSLFEDYGATLLMIGLLLLVAILAGVFLSKEVD